MGEIGKVIILNGASSSGKSTLAYELQKCMNDVYLNCSLDMFWNMTPTTISANSINFPRLKLAMAQSVKAMATTGHNVIIDIVLGGSVPNSEFIEALDGIETLIVKVDCTLQELERREVERGNRELGLAKSQLMSVHKDIIYDLEINTTTQSPEICAQKIATNFVS